MTCVDFPKWRQWLGTNTVANPYKPEQQIDLRKLVLVRQHESPQSGGLSRLSCEFICKDGSLPQLAIFMPEQRVWVHVYPAGSHAAQQAMTLSPVVNPERTQTMQNQTETTANVDSALLEDPRFPGKVDLSSKKLGSGWAKEASARRERLERSLGEARVPNHA